MKNITKNPWLLAGITAVVIGSLAFYGGMLYGKNKRQNNFPGRQMGQQMGANRRIQAGSMINGTILSKDDKSLTIKTPNGGSKIVFFATSTKALKSTEASMSDFNVNDNVIASGQTNADGSITAQMIQLRQDDMMPGGPGEPRQDEPKK